MEKCFLLKGHIITNEKKEQKTKVGTGNTGNKQETVKRLSFNRSIATFLGFCELYSKWKNKQ